MTDRVENDGECHVCLQPLYDPTTVTFSHPGAPDCPVEFCRDCVEALLLFMTDRWHQAIDNNNAVVDELKRWFGLGEPLKSHDDELARKIRADRESSE